MQMLSKSWAMKGQYTQLPYLVHHYLTTRLLPDSSLKIDGIIAYIYHSCGFSQSRISLVQILYGAKNRLSPVQQAVVILPCFTIRKVLILEDRGNAMYTSNILVRAQ